MSLFLSAKAWQIFLAILIAMLLPLLIGYFINMELNHYSRALWVSVFFIWLYSVGISSNSMLPDESKTNPVVFQVLIFSALISNAIESFIWLPVSPALAHFLTSVYVIGFFYGIWFTSKRFVMFDSGGDVKFKDYRGAFLCFWVWPMGVWSIQPKVNDAFNKA